MDLKQCTLETMVNRLQIFESFKNKKVFITGHSGFKGSWLTFVLDYFGAITFGYSLKPKNENDIIQNIKFSKNFNFCYNDIRDYESLYKELKNFNPDFIFHLAAQPLVLESISEPYYTHEVNYTGTLNVLESIRSLNLKSVNLFITTDKVYKNNNSDNPFIESDPLGGIDPYSASKASSEILIKSYYETFFKNTGIKVSTLRAGNIIGGGDWSENRLIPDIIKSYYNKEKLLIRNSKAIRPWQHVLDAIFGYLLLANKMNNKNKKYSGSWNFGPNKEEFISVMDIINIFKQNGVNIDYSLSKKEFKETKILMLDSSKSHKELKWNKRWNIEDSILKTIIWYRKFFEGEPMIKLIEDNLNEYTYDEIS